MDIPYTIRSRRDTGMYNARLGMWLFIASEVMLFGGLFTTYLLLRLGSTGWPEGDTVLNLPLGIINTIVLIASSVTMIVSRASLLKGNIARFRFATASTLLLGSVFLAIKGYEYMAKIDGGLLPSTNTFLGIYFTLTGLHALHVIGGLVAMGWLLGSVGRIRKEDPDRLKNRVEVAGMYWHFVDIVWLFIFTTLYLF